MITIEKEELRMVLVDLTYQVKDFYELNFQEIAEVYGMTYRTLRRVLNGETFHIPLSMIQALDALLGDDRALDVIRFSPRNEALTQLMRKHDLYLVIKD